MSMFRVPADTHSVIIVTLASVATVYYTMYPWIQEQKQQKLQQEHENFQALKQQDPKAAQQYINQLAESESWFQRQYRSIFERKQLLDEVRGEFFDSRAQHSETNVQLPAGIYQPLTRDQLYNFPSERDLETSIMRGKSLSVPEPAQAAFLTQHVRPLQEPPSQPLQPITVEQQRAQVDVAKQAHIPLTNSELLEPGTKMVMHQPEGRTQKITMTSTFDFNSLMQQPDPTEGYVPQSDSTVKDATNV